MSIYLPSVGALRVLKLFGIEVALYPDLFGHQAFDVEHRLRSEVHKRRWRKVYLKGDHQPNQHMLKLHRHHALVLTIPNRIFKLLREVRKISVRRGVRTPFYKRGFEEKLSDFDTWNNVEPRLRFSPAEHEMGQQVLDRLNLKPGQYVCFHSRDSYFALNNYPTVLHHASTGKHSINPANVNDRVKRFEESLFQTYRNSAFRDYSLALEWLEDQGLRGVRVGASGDNLEGLLPNLVDFGGRWRGELGQMGDFADLYVMANCKFYVGTATGVTVYALAMGRPLVWVNSFPWPWAHTPPVAGSIYMPKLWSLHDQNHLASFEEMIEFSRQHDWRAMYQDEFIRHHGLRVTDNTQIEIRDAVAEMDARLNGTLPESHDDALRQQQLAAMFGPGLPMHGCPATMARSFLKNHSALLDSQPNDFSTSSQFTAVRRS